MTKPELGIKRICSGCSLKFYDLHKTPIVCPTCNTVFEPPKAVPAKLRRPWEAKAAPASRPISEQAPAPIVSDNAQGNGAVAADEEDASVDKDFDKL